MKLINIHYKVYSRKKLLCIYLKALLKSGEMLQRLTELSEGNVTSISIGPPNFIWRHYINSTNGSLTKAKYLTKFYSISNLTTLVVQTDIFIFQ